MDVWTAVMMTLLLIQNKQFDKCKTTRYNKPTNIKWPNSKIIHQQNFLDPLEDLIHTAQYLISILYQLGLESTTFATRDNMITLSYTQRGTLNWQEFHIQTALVSTRKVIPLQPPWSINKQ